MKGIKECGNCLHWEVSEDWDENWNPCSNVIAEDLIAVATEVEEEAGEEIELIFHREFSCRGYDYNNESKSY